MHLLDESDTVEIQCHFSIIREPGIQVIKLFLF